jgi:hypothetical protein
MQTVVVMGGANINNSAVADEYGRIIYCEIFKKVFKNDFEWNNVRRQIISRVLEQREMYRNQFELRGLVRLDRYDFERQLFPLTPDTKLTNVGRMSIFHSREYKDPCPSTSNMKTTESFKFPPSADLVLTQPLNLEFVKVSPDVAERILKEMQKMRIADRSLFVRFRFRVVDTPVILKDNLGNNATADMIGQIQQVDFFLDREMTKWVVGSPTAPR